MIIRKAEDQNASEEVTDCGWEFEDGTPIPVVAQCDQAPTGLIDVIRWQNKTCDKKYFTEASGCHTEHFS